MPHRGLDRVKAKQHQKSNIGVCQAHRKDACIFDDPLIYIRQVASKARSFLVICGFSLPF